jgi:osmotically inducible protein OsmC
MKRSSSAYWEGNLLEGKGLLTTQSKILNKTNYTFKNRFYENENGTNPEELLAAAYAGCFTMAVVAALTKLGITPVFINTEANIFIDKMVINNIHLSISGSMPGIYATEFNALAETAKNDCIISKALKIPVSLESSLENNDVYRQQ